MFTGLIEEIGSVKKVKSIGGGIRIQVSASKIMDDLKIDDSVSINGACQTVVSLTDNSFEAEAVEETLLKTTLGKLKTGDMVNLERAALPSSRLGGHFVQGHIDCIGELAKIDKLQTAVNLWFSFPKEFSELIVPTGSICINGVSLTSARVENNQFMVAIIPHTYKSTNLIDLNVGGKVNLEFDIIGKYVVKMLNASNTTKKTSSLDKYITQPMD
ncbi:MAG: riboflavin synthase [bacterium]